MRHEIVPDASLIIAVERTITGASTHILHNLLQRYQLACYVANEELARAVELELVRILRTQRKILEH